MKLTARILLFFLLPKESEELLERGFRFFCCGHDGTCVEIETLQIVEQIPDFLCGVPMRRVSVLKIA